VKHNIWKISLAIGLAVLVGNASPAAAQTAPSLGAAQSFAVLGATTVTNTGASVIVGDLGLSPGTSVTGFPPGVVVSGTIHAADAAALAAQTAVTSAYNNLAGQACTANLTGQNLGGLTLTAGVYCFDTTAQLTGVLTLNAQGNANAVFIFKIGSTLTTASGSSVLLINSGSLCNIFWQVGSSATLGTTTSFAGNILALASITLTTGANITGRAFARNGAVTLDTNQVTATCASGPVPPACPVITLSPATLPNGTATVAYSQTITASGGTAPYTFALVSGSLPAGLSLTAGGIVTGTPTTAGSSTFTVRATDANGCTGTIAYTIVIAAAPVPPPVCPVVVIAPLLLPPATAGLAYSQTFTGSGGTGPYTFGITSGALPTGLTLTAAGLLSGTPLASGSYSFSVRGTDVNGCFATLPYTFVVAPAICPVITLTPATLPAGTLGVAYSQSITGSGGTAPYAFSVVSGAVPAGLTLTTAGLLSGTPTTLGSTTFSVRGTDANGCFATVSYTLVVAAAVCPVISLTPATLGVGTVGVAYSQTITASGGTAPYIFTVVAGALPTGLTLTTAGLVSGTPTTAATSTFTVRGTDANSCFAEIPYSLIVAAPVPTLPEVFMILLALGLAGVAFYRLRGRQLTA
jgi:hypothetical protein